MHLRRVPFGAVAIELFPPFHHVAIAAIFLDQPGDNLLSALALALRTLDAQHVELALDIAKDEIRSSHCGASDD